MTEGRSKHEYTLPIALRLFRLRGVVDMRDQIQISFKMLKHDSRRRQYDGIGTHAAKRRIRGIYCSSEVICGIASDSYFIRAAGIDELIDATTPTQGPPVQIASTERESADLPTIQINNNYRCLAGISRIADLNLGEGCRGLHTPFRGGQAIRPDQLYQILTLSS